MTSSFNLATLRNTIAAGDFKNRARLVIGALLLLNLIALYFVLYPPEGSASDLENRRLALQSSIQAKQVQLNSATKMAGKTVSARTQGDQFIENYFLDKRFASSILVEEIVNTAKQVGIQPREHSIIEEPIDGSTNLATRTITGNYEGTYADLLEMVNAIDRSQRFLLIESLTAAPQMNGGLLFQVRYKAFVREVTS